MRILAAWKDSLSLLLPKNGKRFLLLTVLTLTQAYAVFIRYWGWLFVPTAGMIWWSHSIHFLESIERYNLYSAMQGNFLGTNGIATLFSGLFLFLFLLSLRPSVGLKNYHYFSSYWSHALWSIATLFIGVACMRIGKQVAAAQGAAWVHHVWPIKEALFGVWFLFCVLFLLDSAGRFSDLIRSWYRALTMVFYNIPILLIAIAIKNGLMYALFWGETGLFKFVYCFFLTTELVRFVWFLGYVMVCGFLATVPVCFFANFAIQKVHEQYKLYF